MSEKKKKIILFSYFVFVGVVCLFAILNHELAEAQAEHKISELQSTLGSLEEKMNGLSMLASSDQKAPEETTEKPPALTENKYVLKEYNGYIGIFTSSGELLRELDVYVKTLPKKDREMLSYGIEAMDDAELYSLIEDYTS